ncbi:MAG: hypothetical protein ABJA67_12260 [Chthonomonadales bacterium]
MDLDEVLDLVIERSKFGLTNERQTEQRIIQPILEAIGYSVMDYDPQTHNGKGYFPDYTMLAKSVFTWFLEAKKWGEVLTDDHAVQVLNYTNTEGCRWAVLTNGRNWRLYDNSIQGIPSDKFIREFTINETEDFKSFAIAISKECIVSQSIEKQVIPWKLNERLKPVLMDPRNILISSLISHVKHIKGLSDVTPEDLSDWFAKTLSDKPAFKLVSYVALKPLEETMSTNETVLNSNEWMSLPELVVYLARYGTSGGTTTPHLCSIGEVVQKPISSWIGMARRIVAYALENCGQPLPIDIPYCPLGEPFIDTKPIKEKVDNFIVVNGQKYYINHTSNASQFADKCIMICDAFGIDKSTIFVKLRVYKGVRRVDGD